MSGRKSLESSLRQLEREKALLQHKSLESHRKAENEADRKRCLENEGGNHPGAALVVHRRIDVYLWIILPSPGQINHRGPPVKRRCSVDILDSAIKLC